MKSSALCVKSSDSNEALGLNKFISSQPYYNMLGRDIKKNDVPRCLKEGRELIPYSPLAQGLLSEK